MKVIGRRLFVSGYLLLEPTHERVNVAMWDGHKWDSLGSGLNGPAYSLLEHGGALYFGGAFSAAGGKSSFGIARWDGLTPILHAKTLRLSQGRPNPFSAASNFSFTLEREATIRVAVYDAFGREVRVLDSGVGLAGQRTLEWDGKDGTGRKVPAGVYFISVQVSNGPAASRKVVLLR